jgi:hypothetical protein
MTDEIDVDLDATLELSLKIEAKLIKPQFKLINFTKFTLDIEIKIIQIILMKVGLHAWPTFG